MMKLRVGVLRGGPSSEYEVSLKTGASVLQHLPEDKYVPVDIFLDRDGTWHHRGRPIVPTDLSDHVDVVWNALHGHYGEDGKVQKVLEDIGIPYTGSGVLPSAIGMHKAIAKEHLSRAGIRTPEGWLVAEDDDIQEALYDIFRNSKFPLVVKPVTGGSSVATHIVRSYAKLLAAVADAMTYGDVLIEEFVAGREATVGVIDANDDGEVFALPPVEIVPPPDAAFFDYEAKYGGGTSELCPGRFTPEENAELRRLAALAHKALGLRHYSRADFIVSRFRGIYMLEVNTLPGLTSESLLPKALRASGVLLPEFLDHVIGLAIER